MKKSVYILVAFIMALGFFPKAYAEDVTIFPEECLFDGYELIEGYDSVTPFSVTPKIDYSRLDGVLTVEVSSYDENTVLLVGEYTAEDKFLKAHIIYDVKDKNPINISGSYEKIFLWEMPGMFPQCNSVSTKCDYEIVEGIEGEWEVSEDGHTLYNYIGSDTDVVIPNSYMGKRIYTVQNEPDILAGKYNKLADTHHYNIFNSRKDITSATISGGIKVIGGFVFANCEELKGDISIPESVRTIGGYAYYNCKALTGTLKLPDLERINIYAFALCSKLTGALDIPEGVEEIGNFAFTHCSGFNSLTLPSSLKKIGVAAFQNQTNISNELVLPDGLEHIGDMAFNHCAKLSNTELDIPSSVKTIGGDYAVSENTGYGCHVFYDSFKKVKAFNADGKYFTSVDGVLYSADMKRLVAYPPAKSDTAFEIPEGVIQLDEMSLGYSKITDLTLPDSFEICDVPQNVLNDMANNLAVAFYHNNAIKNVWTKPTNTRYTSQDGIVYSKDLKDLWYVPTKKTGTITVLDGTENIQKGAFYIEYSSGGETYTGVYIPASVKNIDDNNLTSINIRPLSEITVDENNLYYEVVDGKLKGKTQ